MITLEQEHSIVFTAGQVFQYNKTLPYTMEEYNQAFELTPVATTQNTHFGDEYVPFRCANCNLQVGQCFVPALYACYDCKKSRTKAEKELVDFFSMKIVTRPIFNGAGYTDHQHMYLFIQYITAIAEGKLDYKAWKEYVLGTLAQYYPNRTIKPNTAAAQEIDYGEYIDPDDEEYQQSAAELDELL